MFCGNCFCDGVYSKVYWGSFIIDNFISNLFKGVLKRNLIFMKYKFLLIENISMLMILVILLFNCKKNVLNYNLNDNW